jgi:tetratricopeptide (TPR) repeat protein
MKISLMKQGYCLWNWTVSRNKTSSKFEKGLMKRLVVLLVFSVLTIGTFYFVLSLTEPENSLVEEAYQAYKQGEKSNTVTKRVEFFNKALSLYSDLEEKFNTKQGSGKLYYNIGNSYFQLGQYPLAVLYYYRALALMPKNEKVQRNLEIALSKLNISSRPQNAVVYKIFFFHYGFSLPERLNFFFIFALLGMLIGSVYIWTEVRLLKKSAILLALIATVFLGSIAYTNYLSPLEGVIIKSTSLYRDAGRQYAKVLKEPIFSGTRVEILNVLQEGHWLKIMTPEGFLGFVPQSSIKII